MSARTYSVETRHQAALILGEGLPAQAGSLAVELGAKLKQHGIFAVDQGYSLHSLEETHDLDYLIWCAPFSPDPGFLSTLTPVLHSQGTKLIVLRHLSTPLPNLPLGTPHLELVYTDYLGPTQFVSPLLSGWATTLSHSHTLSVPGDGLAELSLLAQTDLVVGLVGAITSPHPPGHQLFVVGEHPVSLLNLAYDLRTSLPYKITLAFDPLAQVPSTEIDLPRLTVPETTTLSELLQRFVGVLSSPAHPAPSSAQPLPSSQPLAAPAAPPSAPARPSRLTPLRREAPVFVPLPPTRSRFSLRSFSRKIWPSRPTATTAITALTATTLSRPLRLRHIIARGLLAGFALYLGSLAFAGTITALSLRSLATRQDNTLPPSSSLVQFTTSYLQANLYVYSLIPGVGGSSLLADTRLLLDAYQQLLGALKTAHSLSVNSSALASAILGHGLPAGQAGGGDLPRLISDSRLQSETLYQQLSLLDGTLPDTPPSSLPARLTDNYQRALSELVELKRSVLMSKAVLSILPDLIGIGGRRKYGVLFQNNMELRATGGFIGSFAILSFENGTLYDMPVYDVYAADGALKGHVEPPKPIKDILGEANWYLRDSNFDPDFPTSARRAEWFIQKTLNQTLDGTFALNLNSFRSLLEVTGPLTIPDYNETINAGNLYERAQYHAEVNFFPGSTQKKEFLSAVGNALFSHLSALPAGEGLPIMTTLLGGLASRDILLSVATPTTEHVLSTLGWNGAVTTPPDGVMVVDSNFGVNKANFYVSRATQVILTINKDLTTSHALRLRYTNAATSNTWPAGSYKNYSRILLPAGSKVSSLRVGDKTLSPSDYTVTTEHDRTVVGYLFTVPINSSVGVELTYQTPLKLDARAPNYSWYWQKQPGTSSRDSLTVYLNYPLYLKPGVVSPAATVNPQQLQFDWNNDMDHRLSINFIQ